MPFVAETGAGVANANSLTTVEFADAYHAERGNDAWAPIPLERKQALLIKATDYLVGVYATAFLGSPVAAGQALPFPRTVNYTNVGNPTAIQASTAELALIAHTQSLTPVGTRGKKRVKVGPIEVEYDGNSPAASSFAAAMLKLIPWLKAGATSGGFVRLQRV